jgi:hypothetical protein
VPARSDAISTNVSQEVVVPAYEGQIIHFPKLPSENVENLEIPKFLRNSLRSANLSGADMTDPKREEFDAKLATVEAHTETRFVELGGKIDRVGDSITVLSSTMTSELGGVKSELMTGKADNKYTRWTIVLAVLAAIGALWVTQSNLLSAFQTGLLLKSEQVVPPTSATRPPNTR